MSVWSNQLLPGAGRSRRARRGRSGTRVSPFPGGVVELYVGGRSHFSNPGPAPVGDQLPRCPLRPAGSVAGSGSHLLLKALRGMPFTVLRVSGWPLPPGTTVGFRCSVARPRQHQACRSASSELGGGARPGRLPSIQAAPFLCLEKRLKRLWRLLGPFGHAVPPAGGPDFWAEADAPVFKQSLPVLFGGGGLAARAERRPGWPAPRVLVKSVASGLGSRLCRLLAV